MQDILYVTLVNVLFNSKGFATHRTAGLRKEDNLSLLYLSYYQIIYEEKCDQF